MVVISTTKWEHMCGWEWNQGTRKEAKWIGSGVQEAGQEVPTDPTARREREALVIMDKIKQLTEELHP